MRRLTFLTDLQLDTRGATAVEYGLVLALVVIAMLTALGSMANRTISIWNDVSSKVTAVVSS